MNLAEHVWVLAQGRLIAGGTPREVTADDKVVEAYLGHGTAPARQARASPSGAHERVLDIDALRTRIRPSRSAARRRSRVDEGEIVVLLGSNGAGKSTLNNTVCGINAVCKARVRFDGARPEPAPALSRRREGRPDPGARRPRIFPNLSVRENLELGSFSRARETRAATSQDASTSFRV